MSMGRAMRKRRKENGIALLISIFVLLLISVVAIAMIVASSTETSLAGNYRSSTNVYYAALAGMEEARGRLVRNNPDYVLKADAQFLPPPGTPLNVGDRRYILNPNPALNENMGNVLTLYPDNEYATEFPAPPTSTRTIASVSSNNAQGIPGPLFKWVRINAVSEQWLRQGLGQDVAPFDGTIDATPLFYDGANLTDTPSSGKQVLEITALAALPNGSQKIVQYLAAPLPLNLSFQAALTLDGNNVQFTASNSPSFWVGGNDQGSVGACNPGAPASAVGYTTGSLSDFEKPGNPLGIPIGPPSSADLRNHYTPFAAPNPDIVPVTLSPNLQTVGGLNALVQTIQQNADVVINGNATQSNMPAGMSATNPMTIVINGDLTFSGWRSTGYGLLLVTGKFTYDPDASWDGIILVVGQGWMYSHQAAYTNTQIQGAVFLARTLDASGNPLPQSSAPIFTPVSSASPSGFDFHNTPGSLTNGIYYSSCWIQAAMPASGYKILSFHEISQ
jgi:hypothetical protein